MLKRMAHHKSALKRIRQSKKRRLYNRLNKKSVKVAIKAVREAKTYDEAMQKLSAAMSVLDRVSAKGVMHKNNAANKKSGLASFVKRMQAAKA